MAKIDKELLKELNKLAKTDEGYEGAEDYGEYEHPFVALMLYNYGQGDSFTLGKHKVKLVRTGPTEADVEMSLEDNDGVETEWVFTVDDQPYALYGYYSSYESHQLTNETPVEVKLTEKKVQYYKKVA